MQTDNPTGFDRRPFPKSLTAANGAIAVVGWFRFERDDEAATTTLAGRIVGNRTDLV